MRYAVIADVHGNLPALESVLREAACRGVDDYLILGDLVGYGPFPNECIAAIAALEAPAVAGNHDLIALGDLSDERCIRLARRTLRWTRSVLTSEARSYLQGRPMTCAAAGGVVCAHGTLADPQEYLTTPEQAIDNLKRLRLEHPEATILLVGHTHRSWACGGDGRVRQPGPDGRLALGEGPVVLNPGAVGQVRGGPALARFLVLDTDARDAAFVAVPYDVARTRRELRRHGLPRGTYRLNRSVLGVVRRTARAAGSALTRWG